MSKGGSGHELEDLEADIFRARTSSNALKSLLSERSDASRNASRRTSRASSPSLRFKTPDDAIPSEEVPVLQVSRHAPAMVRSAAPPQLQTGIPNGDPADAPVSIPPKAYYDVELHMSNAPSANLSEEVSVDSRPPSQSGGETPIGRIEVSTIKSLKDTIESLLRDLNKAITERDSAMQEVERLAAAVATAQAEDTHGMFLRQEVKSLRENKAHLEEALRENVQAHQTELQELRQRFVEEIERSAQEKSVAIEDIEQSYSEALRAAQARTSEAREETRKTNERADQFARDLEAVRAQLRQVESDRAFQVSTLEDERRQFNKFREEAMKKNGDLTDKGLEHERRLTDAETKLRSANLELAAEKQERDRACDKLRQELETVMQSRDNARSSASKLRRELDTAVEENAELRRTSAKQDKDLREMRESKTAAEKATIEEQNKLLMLQKTREQEMEDLAEIKRSLVSHQKEHAALQERAQFRLKKVRDAVKPDTLFVQFNQTPSAERAQGAASPAPEVVQPSSSNQLPVRSAAPAPVPSEEECFVQTEDTDLPQVQRTEAARVTRSAAPPPRDPPAPAAQVDAHADALDDGISALPDLHGDAAVQKVRPAMALAAASQNTPNLKPPISPPSEGLRSVAKNLGPSPPPAPETGKGWFPHGRNTPEVRVARAGGVVDGEPLPPMGTSEEAEIEDVFLEAPVRALADIYVVSARDVPEQYSDRPIHVHIRIGGQAVMTRAVRRPRDKVEVLEWHSNFRCASSDPEHDIIIFDVEAVAGKGDAEGKVASVTPDDGVEWVLLGRVAVPLSRVLTSGKEAGWYEVRNLVGAPIYAAPGVPFRLQIGCAAATVDADIQRKPLKAGYLYARIINADGQPRAGDGWVRRHALLDPYTQLMFLTENRLLVPPLVVEGSNSCISVRTGTATSQSSDSRELILQNEEEQRVALCAMTADSISDWLDCLEIAGAQVLEFENGTGGGPRSRPPSSTASITNALTPSKPPQLLVGVERLGSSLATRPSATQKALQNEAPAMLATRSAPRPIAPATRSHNSAFDDDAKVVVSIKGVRDLPPNSSGGAHGMTVLRNPFVLVSLRSGRFRSRVVELSLNPVFNQYAIIHLNQDPIVLVEVFDDDKGEGNFDAVLLGSAMLSADVLGPLPAGKEKKLWLPLSSAHTQPSSPSATPGNSLVPHILVSILTYQGDAGKSLEGEPLDLASTVGASDVLVTAPASARAMQQQQSGDSTSSGVVCAADGRSEVCLDDWESKSAAVKAQLQEAAEWFKDEDVVKLMEGARHSRGSRIVNTSDGGGGAWVGDAGGRTGVQDLPDASMPVIFM